MSKSGWTLFSLDQRFEKMLGELIGKSSVKKIPESEQFAGYEPEDYILKRKELNIVYGKDKNGKPCKYIYKGSLPTSRTKKMYKLEALEELKEDD